jgi:hypothetical protein
MLLNALLLSIFVESSLHGIPVRGAVVLIFDLPLERLGRRPNATDSRSRES